MTEQKKLTLVFKTKLNVRPQYDRSSFTNSSVPLSNDSANFVAPSCRIMPLSLEDQVGKAC